MEIFRELISFKCIDVLNGAPEDVAVPTVPTCKGSRHLLDTFKMRQNPQDGLVINRLSKYSISRRESFFYPLNTDASGGDLRYTACLGPMKNTDLPLKSAKSLPNTP